MTLHESVKLCMLFYERKSFHSYYKKFSVSFIMFFYKENNDYERYSMYK